MTQSTDAKGQLRVFLQYGVESGTGAFTPRLEMPIRRDSALSCLTVQPHGLAWSDASGRIFAEQHVWETPNVDPMGVDGDGSSRATCWAGAQVKALAWRDAETLIAADVVGRLMAFDVGHHGEDQSPTMRLIAAVDRPWQVILPIDDNHMAAVSAGGDFVVLDNTGHLIDKEHLPIGRGHITAARFCAGVPLLLYRVSSDFTSSHPAPSAQVWCAWHPTERQAVALPDTLRYADTIATHPSEVWAMNAQGMSWRWKPPHQSSEHDVLAIHSAEPEPLVGWPSGPCREVIALDHASTVIRVDLKGRTRTMMLDGGMWRPSSDQLPEAIYLQLAVSELGTLERDAERRAECLAHHFVEQALQAHREQRGAECQQLLDQLETLAPSSPKADVLRTRIAAERSDFIAALTHLRWAVMNDGFSSTALLTHYGRLLYRVGALDELACFDPCQWPTLATELPADIDLTALHSDAFCLIDTSPASGSLPGFRASGRCASVTQTLGRPNANIIDAGDEHSWQELAWSCVRQWGSAGPYRLGADHFASLPLHPSDLDLFAEAMGVCGAQARATAVFTTAGGPYLTQGWVFSDPVPGTPMHRQLVAWRSSGPSETLSMCLAVSTDRFASPQAWCAAWDALQDTAWQADMRRRVAIVRESIRCGLAPDPALLTLRPHEPAVPAGNRNDESQSELEEVYAW